MKLRWGEGYSLKELARGMFRCGGGEGKLLIEELARSMVR
jgi:hypothetical protein